MGSVVIVTGASSGFGAMTARALVHSGHTLYAGLRETAGRDRKPAAEFDRIGHSLELDVSDQSSVDGAVARVIDEAGRIDVVVHNAGHMTVGPAEAFTVEQFAAVYDTNVLSTNHYAHAGHPDDTAVADEYARAYDGAIDDLLARQAKQAPPDEDLLTPRSS